MSFFLFCMKTLTGFFFFFNDYLEKETLRQGTAREVEGKVIYRPKSFKHKMLV